ncbi:MAG: ribonuclease BN [Acidocella sp. 20-61-6]|nr:MAG: ribonuclease BN [Acidocella sp. 20-61-6]
MVDKIFDRKHLPLLKASIVQAGRATASQRVSLVAAGCAFYATLALFPAITMLISLYGLAYDPSTVQPQLHYLASFMPPAAFALISNRIQTIVSEPANGLGLSFVVSLVISLWSSSTGTKSVMNALTLAYDETETRGMIKFQLVSLGMTLVAIIGVAMAIGILVLIPIALAFVGISASAKILVAAISFLAMVGFVVAALGLLYRFGPSGGDRIFYAPGATLATMVWLLASWAFGLYVGHFAAYSATYGPLATLIGLMMWFYLSAYIVLFGAEWNAALDAAWKREKEHERRDRPARKDASPAAETIPAGN